MPFIGNQPALSYTSFAVQHFTTSATTSYTLDHSVANENEIRLVINNVVQQPGSSYAYTASGTTLTLSAATSATDTMYAVFLGKAVQTVTPASGSVTNAMIVDGTIAESKLASGVNTITMADQWRVTATTNVGTNDVITTNWERNDSSTYGKIGTGLTESSGIFSFPSTGLYAIFGNFTLQVNSDSQAIILLSFTTDNSSYSTSADGIYGTSGSSGVNGTLSFTCYFNVTDITTHKFRFSTNNFATNTYVIGATGKQRTGFTVIRLGDSV